MQDLKKQKQHLLWKDHCIHSGAVFHPPYVHKHLELKHVSQKNVYIALPASAEEMGIEFAKCIMKMGTLSAQFKANFWEDWVKLMQSTASKSLLKKSGLLTSTVDDWDWIALLYAIDEHHPSSSTSTYASNSDQDECSPNLGVALIDGKQHHMTSNGMLDRPGIFIGRGDDHPLSGKIRQWLQPHDVEINISADAPVPTPRWKRVSSYGCQQGYMRVEKNRTGGWKAIFHEPRVGWLARWTDQLTGNPRYISLDESTFQKQSQEKIKFDMARSLSRNITAVRKRIHDDVMRKSAKLKQLSLCAALIDAFGIRSGSGGESSRLDGRSVGATSLRINNIITDVDNHAVRLRFTGKDQVCFNSERKMPEHVVRALNDQLKRTIRSRKRDSDGRLFWLVKPETLNKYLNSMLPGLTAKVMRTMTASGIMEKRLAGMPSSCRSLPAKLLRDLIVHVGIAEVAWACNHKRHLRIRESEEGVEEGCKCRGFDNENEESLHIYRLEFEFLSAIEQTWNAAIQAARHDPLDEMQCEGCTENRAELYEELEKKIRIVRAKSAALRLSPETAKINYIDPRIIDRFLKKCDFKVKRSDIYSNKQLKRFSWAFSPITRGVSAPKN